MTEILTLDELKAFLRLDPENLDEAQEAQLELVLSAALAYVHGAVDNLSTLVLQDSALMSTKVVVQMIASELWHNRFMTQEKPYQPTYMVRAFLLQLQTTPLPEVSP